MEIYQAMSEEQYVPGYLTALVRHMVTGLVDDALSVSVVATPGEGDGVGTIVVMVAKADLGKVIGKQGRTARSLRTIVGAIGQKNKQRFSLDIQPAVDRSAAKDRACDEGRR